ncbi:ABC transporter permease [Enterocloster clostridioformis]|jgi:hypothetical protein|uniref:ABC transporter permease n=1 Tax=Enterocloster clostridioformis TaxID=1531 RepID=A0A174U414_9FIRM|nr:ABC transporter permease [Enterocloster clostridioformis]
MIIDFIIEDLMLNSYLQKNFHTLMLVDTTLCSLIPRFYEVSAGAVCLDGVDIRHIKLIYRC